MLKVAWSEALPTEALNFQEVELSFVAGLSEFHSLYPAKKTPGLALKYVASFHNVSTVGDDCPFSNWHTYALDSPAPSATCRIVT